MTNPDPKEALRELGRVLIEPFMPMLLWFMNRPYLLAVVLSGFMAFFTVAYILGW